MAFSTGWGGVVRTFHFSASEEKVDRPDGFCIKAASLGESTVHNDSAPFSQDETASELALAWEASSSLNEEGQRVCFRCAVNKETIHKDLDLPYSSYHLT
ncbi:hypothetical protein TNCT_421951 [Trichonephila clavata]|uniref:Uncharacterized protein n=1 Tax=Trichonephila clavata TaxID=2740835 RepID=A0A8X6L2Y3_TRICU|nr:hypothetical protein TNCT_421951 [Trichonephila clavata]